MTNALIDVGKSFWGINSGRTDDVDLIFLKHNQVALGWVRINDLFDSKYKGMMPLKRVCVPEPARRYRNLENWSGMDGKEGNGYKRHKKESRR